MQCYRRKNTGAVIQTKIAADGVVTKDKLANNAALDNITSGSIIADKLDS